MLIAKREPAPTDEVVITFRAAIPSSLTDEQLREWVNFSLGVGGINRENPAYEWDHIQAEFGTINVTRRRSVVECVCAHCSKGFRGKETDDSLCADCFMAGHRGRTCDQYCK